MVKFSTGDNYHGRYRKGMRDGGGKNHLRAYEGIFSKLHYNARKGGRNIPKFSFFQADEGTCRIGICKLCMTRVKVFYTQVGNEPFLVNIDDKELHRKWIGSGGWHCIISKNVNKGESETMKRLKNKKWKAPETDDDAFYVEPE